MRHNIFNNNNNNNRVKKYLALLAVSLILCGVYVVFVQGVVMCGGYDNNSSIKLKMDINQVITTGVAGTAGAAMVKYCPPNARLRAALGIAGIWGAVTTINNYF